MFHFDKNLAKKKIVCPKKAVVTAVLRNSETNQMTIIGGIHIPDGKLIRPMALAFFSSSLLTMKNSILTAQVPLISGGSAFDFENDEDVVKTSVAPGIDIKDHERKKCTVIETKVAQSPKVLEK